jgi:hypothetical protein
VDWGRRIEIHYTHQSAHCGKVDLKVSVQAHLITSMNAPGLKTTFQNGLVVVRVIATLGTVGHTEVKLASAGAAWAQLFILG